MKKEKHQKSIIENVPLPPLVAVVGPTACGKSDLAVRLALDFNGEVVSADSRQVYHCMDIGTGKITRDEMRGVPHHLLDVADPQKQFSVAEYQSLARKAIADIHARNRLPIICGGAGLYVRSIIDNQTYPNVPPNQALRKKFNNSTTVELLNFLKRLDPRRAEKIEKDNPRRLIRAIEIATALGSVPAYNPQHTSYSLLIIGLLPPNDELLIRIRQRLLFRLKNGMIEEVERLHAQGLSWQRLDDFGLEYRFIARFLQGMLTREEMIQKLETAIWQYSRRQITWWKKDTRVHWLWEYVFEEATALVNVFSLSNYGAQI